VSFYKQIILNCLLLKMNVIELMESNFLIRENNLCINKNGYCILYFKQNNCGICKTFEPQFMSVAYRYPDVSFCSINITSYPNVFRMSEATPQRITGTPTIIFYFDGAPVAKYNNGMWTADGLERFIKETKEYFNKRYSSGYSSAGPSGYLPLSQPNQPQNQQQNYGNAPYDNFSARARYPQGPQSGRIKKGYDRSKSGPDNLYGNEYNEQLLADTDIVPYNTPWLTTQAKGTTY
jgi:thiol-disulfide isomerase/thioredoxin